MIRKQPGILLATIIAFTTAAMPPTTLASNSQNTSGIWIDVRTPQEFDSGHLKNAVNIPFEHIGTHIAAISPDKNVPINLYCRSGRRAETARKTLEQLGYTHVTNRGGYTDLLKSDIRP